MSSAEPQRVVVMTDESYQRLQNASSQQNSQPVLQQVTTQITPDDQNIKPNQQVNQVNAQVPPKVVDEKLETQPAQVDGEEAPEIIAQKSKKTKTDRNKPKNEKSSKQQKPSITKWSRAEKVKKGYNIKASENNTTWFD